MRSLYGRCKTNVFKQITCAPSYSDFLLSKDCRRWVKSTLSSFLCLEIKDFCLSCMLRRLEVQIWLSHQFNPRFNPLCNGRIT